MSVPYIIEKDGNSERTYEIYSRLLKDRIVFIRGVFDDDMSNDIVAQLLYLQSNDPSKDIYMYINSPGGKVSSMYAIYDTMNFIEPDIVTVGIGSVASAGSFILAAGTKGKRMCLENTEIMIHELSSGISGKAGDIFNEVNHMKHLYDKMAKHYSKFTGQKLSKIKKDMQRDYWLSAEEAIEYGLVDKVVDRI